MASSSASTNPDLDLSKVDSNNSSAPSATKSDKRKAEATEPISDLDAGNQGRKKSRSAYDELDDDGKQIFIYALCRLRSITRVRSGLTGSKARSGSKGRT